MGNLILAVVLSVAVATVSCQPNAGSCDQQDLTDYVTSNLDATNCGVNLDTALYANISSPMKDAEIQAICSENCAGRLANWLQGECGGTFNATSLYYLCLGTSNMASIGSYCMYAVPPVFNADLEVTNLVQVCTSQSQCTDQCHNSLQNVVTKLGCCYQTLYNNTEFIRGAIAVGQLAAADLADLQVISQSFSSCGVNPPMACTDEAFGFPTGGGLKSLPQLPVLMLLAILVTGIGLVTIT